MPIAKLAYLTALLIPALSQAEELRIPDSYRWVAEKGMAIGCMKETRLPSTLPPGCADVGVIDLACSMVSKTEFIKDVSECRKHLPTKTGWFKAAGFMDCVATAEADGEGASSFGILEHLPPSECDHNTIEPDDGCEVRAGKNLAFHPSSKMSVEDLVPEILNLAQGAVVPVEVFSKYDSRKIAMTITRKIYQEVEAEKSEKVAKPDIDFMNESALQMAFNDKNIDSIVANGFLNQHQNKKSNGTLDPSYRANAEDTFLGYKLEEKYEYNEESPANKVRPKYSYFGLPRTDPRLHPMNKSWSTVTSGYGNVFAVFNPEVKDRATFTMTDSLGEPKKSIRTPNYRANTPDDPTRTAGIYMEAQIWGELTMKDVKHFIVNCDGFSAVSSEAIEKLKALGKPIYACRVDSKVDRLAIGYSRSRTYGGGMGMGGGAYAPGATGTATDTKTETKELPPISFSKGAPYRVREAGVLYNDPRKKAN